MGFKAAVLTAINEVVVDEVELTPLKFGQVLVKNKISGLCGSQILELEGKKGNAKYMPHLLGHESVGQVEEIGEGIKNVQVGDNVVVHWRAGSGIESDFPQYIFGGKKIFSGRSTTLSEYSIVSENRVTRVDDSDETCALLGCCLSTAMAIINKDANVKFGQSVLILGCGGLGLALAYSAKLVGAGRVVGIDRVDKTDKMAAVNSEFALKLPAQTFDFIFDTTGSPTLVNKAFSNLKDGGKFVFLTPVELNIPTDLMFATTSKQMIFSQGGGFTPQTDLRNYLTTLKNNNFNYKMLVSHRFTLDDINAAIATLRSGEASRILIDF